MTETATVPLSIGDLALLKTGTNNEKENIVESIFDSLEANTSARLLAIFCDAELETYNYNPSVIDVQFESKLSGSIFVEYTVAVYIGRAELVRPDLRCNPVDFVISSEDKTITFSTALPDFADSYPEDEL